MVRKKVEIKEHVLLLKHEKIDEKFSGNLLKKYNITNKQLPFIYKKDSAISDLNAEVGDIIEITRKSPTTLISKFYRLVING